MKENNSIPCRRSITNTILELGRKDKDIICVTSDATGSATLGDFVKELPEQFIEVGIAEQNAVGISAGLASTGKKVFVFGPACFYVARSLEQVKVDMAYSQMPVKIIGVSGGLAYAQLGATHHSLHDIAVLRTFPGMEVYLPCDVRESRKLILALKDRMKPAYVRVGRGAVPDVYDNDDFPFELGKAITVREGSDITLIGCGETVVHCQEAARLLHEDGIEARVLDMFSLKPFDREAVVKAARETGAIITAEEHSIVGGLGSAVAELLASRHPAPIEFVGMKDCFGKSGSYEELSVFYGLDSIAIDDAVKTVIARK